MFKEIEKTCGYVVVDDAGNIINYKGGSTLNGTCFKDCEAFESGKGICYISEYDLKDMHEELEALKEEYIEKNYDEANYIEDYNAIVNNCGYTRENFLNLVGYDENSEDEREKELKIKIAEAIFDLVDWQSPMTLWYEIDLMEFAMDFDLDEEDIKKYFNLD